jgi:DNA-directed RNA polymerase subunit M/transcription elongation factor TFIIS
MSKKRSRWGICPSCKQVAVVDHIGTQQGFEDVPPAELWNCAKCGSTVAERRILFLPRLGRKTEGAGR